MRLSVLFSVAALALGAKVQAGGDEDLIKFGNLFYLGPTTSGQYIVKTTYSLDPPRPPKEYDPSKKDSWLSVWIGVQEDPANRDLADMEFVQPLLNWSPDQEAQGCPADVNHWCVAASTYTRPLQVEQRYVPVSSGATVDFEISINPETKKIDQKVWINGQLQSSQSTSQGMKPQVMYSGNECSGHNCGPIVAYNWNNIVIHLNEPDPQLNTRLMLHNAVSSGMTTPDGGKTWLIESIKIEEDHFDGPQH